MFKHILDAFPPPAFLNIPYTGLSISDQFIRSIQFRRNGDYLKIVKHAEQMIPQGTVVSGQIMDAPGLVRMLESFKKENNIEHVRVSLPEEKAYLFTTKLPLEAQNDIRSAIEFTIEENVPLPASELVFDYILTPLENGADHFDVVVSAIPTTIVDSYVDVLNSAHIPVLSLEIESQAIARAVIETHNTETLLIMHFGKDKVGMYIVSGRVVHFTSTVVIKRDGTDVSELVVQEVKRLYSYWHTLKKNIDKDERQIARIIVCGKNFDESIVSYIASHNDVVVELGNVWTNVFDINTQVPQIQFGDSLRYATVIGLALPEKILI